MWQNFPDAHLSVWRKLVGELAIVTVPGDYVTMCSVNADTLAAALDRCIERALANE